MLDELLQYRSPPEPDGFVEGVMQAVERQQHLRRRILLLCGLIGAIFGVVGASLLADTLMSVSGQLFAASNALVSGPVVLVMLASLAWLLYEEPGLSM